jgi:hypothetical protein
LSIFKKMYLYIIKLKEILHNSSSLDLGANYLALNNSKKPPLLIYGKDLGEAILKSKNFIPINLIDYFKAINNISSSSFPSIEHYFKEAPLFLKSSLQAEARTALSILYKNIENNLLDWLPDFTKKYFNKIKNDAVQNPIIIAEQFTLEVFKKIILTELRCDKNDSIEFPGGILNTYKSKEDLNVYEGKLKILLNFIGNRLAELNRPKEDAWKIISIAVMGVEPLLNSLAFAMYHNTKHKKIWNAETLFYEVAPISFVARLSTKEIEIENILIQKNQDVYISLNLINHLKLTENKIEEKKNSFSFGLGKHMCPGRKISLMIAQIFLNAWENSKEINLNTSNINISRDLVLRFKETNEL